MVLGVSEVLWAFNALLSLHSVIVHLLAVFTVDIGVGSRHNLNIPFIAELSYSFAQCTDDINTAWYLFAFYIRPIVLSKLFGTHQVEKLAYLCALLVLTIIEIGKTLLAHISRIFEQALICRMNSRVSEYKSFALKVSYHQFLSCNHVRKMGKWREDIIPGLTSVVCVLLIVLVNNVYFSFSENMGVLVQRCLKLIPQRGDIEHRRGFVKFCALFSEAPRNLGSQCRLHFSSFCIGQLLFFIHLLFRKHLDYDILVSLGVIGFVCVAFVASVKTIFLNLKGGLNLSCRILFVKIGPVA